MKAKVLLIAAALLMFAAVSFGQGGVDPYTFVQLVHPCGGSDYLPDGSEIWIYKDIDSDGPDATDPLVTLCTEPENNCASGPAGTFDRQMFLLNGAGLLEMPGAFYLEGNINIAGIDLAPNRLFLRVFYPNKALWTTEYTSTIFAMGTAGGQIEAEITSWACRDTSRAEICTPTPPIVAFVPVPGVPHEGGHAQVPPQHMCAKVCAGQPTLINIGPVTCSTTHPRLPNVIITPGCAAGGCQVTCTGENGLANPMLLPTTYAWNQVNVAGQCYMQATIMGVNSGCVCITFDYLLPVEMGNVAVTPADNSAKLTWNTRSESSLARFEIVRDNEVIGMVTDVANTTTGKEYSYVDATAENGHIYTYELVAVGIDGTADVVFNGKVAPNAMYAKPTEYALGQNFPNPFNPTTTISFDIVDTNPVTLMVYNANGQLVTTLLNNVSKDAGRYSINFDASNLTSGLYFYTVKVGNVYTATKKMLLVK